MNAKKFLFSSVLAIGLFSVNPAHALDTHRAQLVAWAHSGNIQELLNGISSDDLKDKDFAVKLFNEVMQTQYLNSSELSQAVDEMIQKGLPVSHVLQGPQYAGYSTKSALDAAYWSDDNSILKKLLKAGADVHSISQSIQSGGPAGPGKAIPAPNIAFAALFKPDKEKFKILLASGKIDLTEKTQDGKTLEQEIDLGIQNLSDLIKNNGADQTAWEQNSLADLKQMKDMLGHVKELQEQAAAEDAIETLMNTSVKPAAAPSNTNTNLSTTLSKQVDDPVEQAYKQAVDNAVRQSKSSSTNSAAE